jgi:hypothetical protein
MASSNPSLKYEKNDNPHNDRSEIRKADGTHIIKVTCPVCEVKYGYNELDGDPGCVACEENQSFKQAKIDKLEKLAKEAEAAEKEAEEFLKKEKALKDRIAKAKDKVK